MKIILILMLLGMGYSLQAQVEDSTKRVLKLDGAVNVRDLGGYQTENGKTVNWGMVYRSADISKLTDIDLTILMSKQISTIVDLREDSEQSQSPDRLPDGVKYVDCSVKEMDNGMSQWIAAMQKAESGDSLFVAFMQKTNHLGEKFSPLFQSLLNVENDKAVLFHCTAGKDRTGIASALFLYALGVPYSTIEADYLASNIYRKSDNERMLKMMVSMGLKENVANDIMLVKPHYLKATFDAIIADYGSVEKFLEKELGVGKKELELLRKKYLV